MAINISLVAAYIRLELMAKQKKEKRRTGGGGKTIIIFVSFISVNDCHYYSGMRGRYGAQLAHSPTVLPARPRDLYIAPPSTIAQVFSYAVAFPCSNPRFPFNYIITYFNF